MDSGDGGAESWQWDDQEADSRDENAAEDERADDRHEPRTRIQWFMRTDEGWVAFVREMVSTLAIVAVIGLLLFAASGLWPPVVVVESGSMAPHLQIGDMVFIVEEHRFAGAAAHAATGVVTFHAGAVAGYTEFHEFGEVIVYQRNGNERTTPIIHRARFWVNESENWYDEANRAFLGSADNCKELLNCPAPHSGFITKGDHNTLYDQAGGISSPVKPSWIIGTAEFRVPWLGYIKLLFSTVSG